jgi:hypothetical protein
MIRRYRWQGNFTVQTLDKQLPPGVSPSIIATSPTLTDIEVLPDPVSATAAQDLDEYMASLGWDLVEVDPSDGSIGELLTWNAGDAILTATQAPALIIRNDRQMLAYQASGAAQSGYFTGVAPVDYDPSNNLRLKLWWVAETANSGDVRWVGAFEKLNQNGPNVDSSNFGPDNAVNDPTNGTNGLINTTIMTFDNVAADDLQPGNPLRIFVRRQSNSGGDTMLGDAQIMRVAILQ